MADDKFAGRPSLAPTSGDKRRFTGPSGATFVPHATVDETTIKSMVESGEWTPVENEKKATAKKSSSAKK